MSRKPCFAEYCIHQVPQIISDIIVEKTNDIKINTHSGEQLWLLLHGLCVSGLTSFEQESTEAGDPSSVRTQLRTRVKTPRT